MRAESAVIEISEIAASTAPLLDRAQAVLQTLGRCLPFDAAWLALADPGSTGYATVGATGLDRSVIDYLDRPSVAQEIELTGYNRDRPPVSVAELAVDAEELPTWAECLMPAGFRDALGVALFESGGPHIGVLSLLHSGRDQSTAATRDRLALLSPLIAHAVSPVRSLLGSARLVRGATAGAVLLGDGSTRPFPGLDEHPLLVSASPVVRIAQHTLRCGQVFRSFMWPCQGSDDHVRITVLAPSDLPAFVSGALLLARDVDRHDLTGRELEVLGLVVAGCSNQQVARRLSIAQRTVAAHVEHILHKLAAPSRTAAAVRAEREGCYVPARRRAVAAGRGR